MTFAILIVLALCGVALVCFFVGFKVGYTELLREELEYGEKLRKQLEADLTPEERNALDWERRS